MAPVYPVLPTRSDTLAAWRLGGGQVAAVFPVHVPRALFRAFGLLPVEVWGPPGLSTKEGDSHLQAYACSIVRSSLSWLLTAGQEAADVYLVPHACDSLQGLASLLLDFLPPGRPVLPLYVPRDHGVAGVAFLAAELGDLADRLAATLGRRPTEDALHEAIAREQAADEALAELLGSRLHLPWSDTDFYRLVRGREFLPAEDFTEFVREALTARTEEPIEGRRLMLSGMVAEPAALLQAIADAGGVVAADDLASSGRRLYPPGRSEDPLERLAESLLGAAPGPTRGSEVQARVDHLVALAERAGVAAVLFWVVKFCEPDLFYLPQVRQALEDRGLHTAVVEVDISDPLPAQAITRLEALLEIAS